MKNGATPGAKLATVSATVFKRIHRLACHKILKAVLEHIYN
jgi:hypothetical protein